MLCITQINAVFPKRFAYTICGASQRSKKNCLTDFYGSDIRALRGIALLLLGACSKVNNYGIVNKPG
jgi:hypothetical protein